MRGTAGGGRRRRGPGRRRLLVAAAAGTVLAGLVATAALTGGVAGLPRLDPGPDPAAAAGPCDGVVDTEVRGPRPGYATGGLDDFPNEAALCRGLWLPRAARWFTPQGLALQGRTAWVSGYRWRPSYGNRPCQLLRVDLRTGARLAFQGRVAGAVGDAPEVFCRHGGGLALDRHGLWLAETGRLWLLDPARVGRGDAVLRVWRLRSPVSGGLLVTGRRGGLGLGDFRKDGRAVAHWYRPADALAPGVVELVGLRNDDTARDLPPRQASARRTTGVPRYAQGGATRTTGRGGPTGTYLTSSTSTCGVLVAPDGTRLGFAPGAEGIAFDRRGHLWAALESGSRGYQRQGRPLTPMLARFDAAQLEAGVAEDCPW